MTEPDCTIKEDQKLCNLTHPIYEILGTSTRRDLIRLISCEHNYGNQLAKILNVSNPTVHRHLKKMIEEGLISEEDRSSSSFSGHKGAEAVFYSIPQGTHLFLAILPHLVHSHIVNTDGDGNVIKTESSQEVNFTPSDAEGDSFERYKKLYERSQGLNEEILELEQALMRKLHEKNTVMSELDKHLERNKLTFSDRIILRSLACLGTSCLEEISLILNADTIMVDHYLKNLADKGWLIEKDNNTPSQQP